MEKQGCESSDRVPGTHDLHITTLAGCTVAAAFIHQISSSQLVQLLIASRKEKERYKGEEEKKKKKKKKEEKRISV